LAEWPDCATRSNFRADAMWAMRRRRRREERTGSRNVVWRSMAEVYRRKMMRQRVPRRRGAVALEGLRSRFGVRCDTGGRRGTGCPK
jgi:hypothetical protein